MAINYDPDLENLLSKTVSSFNAKINKLKSQNIHHLPTLQNLDAIKTSYTNRSDLMYYIKQLQRFNTADAERLVTNKSGVTLTQWEWDKLEQDRVRALKILAQEQKRESTRNMYYSYDRLNTINSERNFLASQAARGSHHNKLTRDQIRTLKATEFKYLNKRERDNQFKENLLKMLTNAFQETGYSPQQIEEVLKDFNSMSAEQLSDAAKNNRFIVSFLEDYAVYVNALNKADKSMLEGALKNITYTYDDYQEHRDAIKNSIEQGNIETW